MSSGYTVLNPGSLGDTIAMESVAYAAAPNTRLRNHSVLAGTVEAAVADVLNTRPAVNAYGVSARLAPDLTLGDAITNFNAPLVGASELLWLAQTQKWARACGGDVIESPPASGRKSPVVNGTGIAASGLWAFHRETDLPSGAQTDDFKYLRATAHHTLMVDNRTSAFYTKWFAASYTTAQTGVALLQCTSGSRLGLNHIMVSVYGTTSGRIQVFFATAADTTYNEGTDQIVLDVTVTPSATKDYQIVLAPPRPILAKNLYPYELKLTTSANVSLTVTGYGFEEGT